eukprot:GABV01008888.1.p2 GENE.GABV01008888.1~~GABV01008888.1.p2  ORF type:complete len:117 (+),score=55.06 GABV01008888.1:221-571(+)
MFDASKRTVFFPSTVVKDDDFAHWQLHDLPGHEQFANLREFIFGHENQILIFCLNAQDSTFYTKNNNNQSTVDKTALQNHLLEWLSRAVDSRNPLVFVVISHIDGGGGGVPTNIFG